MSQHLIDLLFTNLQTIVHFIQQQLAERIITILEEDEYTPMTVNDQKELDGVIDILGSVMKHVEGGKLIRNFPQTLPFTKGFVSIVDLIKKFIRMFYKFSEGFKTQSQELDDVLRKALEMVLGTNLNEVYVEKLSQTNLSQSVQIILNLEFLELSCEELIELINEIQTKYAIYGCHFNMLLNKEIVEMADEFNGFRWVRPRYSSKVGGLERCEYSRL